MTYSSRIEGGWTCDGGVGVVFGHIVVVVQAVIHKDRGAWWPWELYLA